VSAIVGLQHEEPGEQRARQDCGADEQHDQHAGTPGALSPVGPCR
jgi:hypothetical protein